jgi:hypothetical protein
MQIRIINCNSDKLELGNVVICCPWNKKKEFGSPKSQIVSTRIWYKKMKLLAWHYAPRSNKTIQSTRSWVLNSSKDRLNHPVCEHD